MEEGRWIKKTISHTRQEKVKLFLSMNGFFPQQKITHNTKNQELESFVTIHKLIVSFDPLRMVPFLWYITIFENEEYNS